MELKEKSTARFLVQVNYGELGNVSTVLCILTCSLRSDSGKIELQSIKEILFRSHKFRITYTGIIYKCGSSLT